MESAMFEVVKTPKHPSLPQTRGFPLRSLDIPMNIQTNSMASTATTTPKIKYYADIMIPDQPHLPTS